MSKLWIPFFLVVTLLVSSNQGENEKISRQHLDEVKTWPKVFVLSPDPNYPVVCYSGVMFNVSSNETINESRNNMPKSTKTVEKKNTQTIFSLSSDPLYPVTCRVGHIPANLTDGIVSNMTVDEEGDNNGTNITCIRRDYEKNVSAIFLHKAGPIQLAWNLFNSSIPYGYMTIKNVECIGSIKVLNDTVVDCEMYGITVGDKNIGANTACALCG